MQKISSYSGRFSVLFLAGLLLAVIVGGCKKDDSVVGPAPIDIPPQTTVQATVNLQSTTGFVILAGSLVSN